MANGLPLFQKHSMHRFFYNACDRDGQIVRLCEEESRHAVSVLRLKVGSPLVLLDGQGNVNAAKIITATAQQVEVQIQYSMPNNEPITRVTLYQGLPKSDKMEWIVQKCTELGIHAIQPVLFARCDREPGKNADKNRLRLQRIAREAVKQCGRGYIPQVLQPESLQTILPRITMHTCSILAWEEETNLRIADVLPASVPPDVALIIGPEGGITTEEAIALRRAGAQNVTLGPRILRTETAGVAALSSIFTLTGEL